MFNSTAKGFVNDRLQHIYKRLIICHELMSDFVTTSKGWLL